jgi:DNA-binding NarL/FixJ family response regulator
MGKARAKTRDGASEALRIVIVDDHPVVRAGLKQRLLAEEQDIDVCGETDSMLHAYKLIAETNPHVVLLDLALKEGNGLDLIKELRARGDHARILIVSSFPEASFAERCVRAGAQGYLQKDAAMDELALAVRTIMRGKIYLSSDMTSQALRNALAGGTNPGDLSALSDRELQVYDMIGKGMTVSEIADKLLLSIKTVETYRAHLKEKLNLRSSAELARHAYEWSVSRA